MNLYFVTGLGMNPEQAITVMTRIWKNMKDLRPKVQPREDSRVLENTRGFDEQRHISSKQDSLDGTDLGKSLPRFCLLYQHYFNPLHYKKILFKGLRK